MTKLSRKLLLSVLTLAFALITLGATTFAWFTLSTKAEIQPFDIDVTSGAGIEISADGSNYSNFITADQIYAAITRAKSSTILDHVTSKDGRNFTTIDVSSGSPSFDKAANSGWTQFDLWFRSPEKDVEVYMLKNTTVRSSGIDWISDANFQLTSDSESSVVVGQKVTLYGANAVRISTTENKLTGGAGLQMTPGDSSNIFELGGASGDQRLERDIKDYGSVAYYNAKNSNNPILAATIEAAENSLPEVLGYPNMPALEDLNTSNVTEGHVPVSTLKTSYGATGSTYYYGHITVRIWLEGWDPDMFNAIMADHITIHMNFGGHAPSSLFAIEGVPDSPIQLTLSDNDKDTTFTVSCTGYTGNILVETSDETVAIVTIDQETKVVTVTGLKAGSAVIKVYLEGYPHIFETVDVKVELSSGEN